MGTCLGSHDGGESSNNEHGPEDVDRDGGPEGVCVLLGVVDEEGGLPHVLQHQAGERHACERDLHMLIWTASCKLGAEESAHAWESSFTSGFRGGLAVRIQGRRFVCVQERARARIAYLDSRHVEMTQVGKHGFSACDAQQDAPQHAPAFEAISQKEVHRMVRIDGRKHPRVM